MRDQAFTTRLPVEDYRALKALAFYTGTTMASLVVTGVRMVLAAHAGKGIVQAVDEAGARFRATLETWTRSETRGTTTEKPRWSVLRGFLVVSPCSYTSNMCSLLPTRAGLHALGLCKPLGFTARWPFPRSRTDSFLLVRSRVHSSWLTKWGHRRTLKHSLVGPPTKARFTNGWS